MHSVGTPPPAEPRIQRTLYSFGSASGGHFGYMALREDGRIGPYSHPNERGYSFDGAQLSFQDEQGHVSNMLAYHADANCFYNPSGSGLYLLPVLELTAQGEAAPGLPPVLINSIPKSGTYFLEAACAGLGARALRLHLFAQTCHDYRGVPDELMHRDPRDLSIAVPAGAVAHLLRPGGLVVGHVDDNAQLDECAKAGVTVLNCVRDLRAVLVSLYHFKRGKVAAISPADTAWRSLAPVPGFIAFLCCFADRDIAHIRRMAEIILERGEPVIRFEDALAGQVPEVLPGFSLNEALRAARNQATSTYSGRNRDDAAFWSPAAVAFFAESGLQALNERLGYEPGFWLRHAAE
jgi:hypothetical protein